MERESVRNTLQRSGAPGTALQRMLRVRRAGEHDEPTGFSAGAKRIGRDFHGEAGGGAVGIVENQRALRDLCLDFGVPGHGAVALDEKGLEAGEDGGIGAQCFAEEAGDEIAGEVVGSGAEAAGDDDEISAFEGFADGLLDGGGGVGNGDLKIGRASCRERV